MKPTQKNDIKGTPEKKKPSQQKPQWQMPEKAQIIVTPGAEKNFEKALMNGESPSVVTDRRAPAKKAPPSVTKGPQNQKKQPPKKRSEPLTVKEAIIEEIRDRFNTIRLNIQLNSEDIIKGTVCALIMMLFALLQTTFFTRFAPFGAIPDLMLIFVLAVGVYEGEKWGAVIGLVSAFIIQSLGAGDAGPSLLSIVYMPVGFVAGMLTRDYLRKTFPVKLSFVAGAAFLKMITTIIASAMTLNAKFQSILLMIAIPEYFSTFLLSPLPFITVWLCLRAFHKTRDERTDSDQN